MNMNTKTTRLAAVLWVWSVMLATWVWAYAAKQAPALTWDLNNQNQERMMRHPLGSWDLDLNSELENLCLHLIELESKKKWRMIWWSDEDEDDLFLHSLMRIH